MHNQGQVLGEEPALDRLDDRGLERLGEAHQLLVVVKLSAVSQSYDTLALLPLVQA